MAPSKKKGQPNDEAPIVSPSVQNDQSGQKSILQDNVSSSKPLDADAAVPPAAATETNTTTKGSAQNRSSWYTGGSWRSKASPVAQVARESVSVDKGISSESGSHDDSKSRPGQSLSKGVKGSRKSVPLAAEPTCVHATSDAVDKSRSAKAKLAGDEKPKNVKTPDTNKSSLPIEPDVTELKEAPKQPDVVASDTERDPDSKIGDMSDIQPSSNTWLSWWSRPDGYASDGEKMKRDPQPNVDGATTPVVVSAAKEDHVAPAATDTGSANDTDSQLKSELNANANSARSWFGLWSNAQNQQQAIADGMKKGDAAGGQTTENTSSASREPANQAGNDIPPKQSDDNKSKSGEDRPKASGWAFWSSEKVGDVEPGVGETQKQIGELAVADTPSQSHPEAAQFNEKENQKSPESSTQAKSAASLLRLKRGRPNTAKDTSSEPAAASNLEETQPQVQSSAELSEPSTDSTQIGKRPQQSRPNLILPTVRDTYPQAPSLSTLERLTQYVAQSLHLPGSEPPPRLEHPLLTASPPKIQRAVAIGVHGFFPSPLIQRVIGQPTGTSIKFANHAASSIRQWCEEHQPDVKNLEIEKVALEGEGYIADRVATLWKLLLNWLSLLRRADFILVACHSQGVPVAVMLVAKLIQLGCLSPNARVGICAMAGINLGPFAEYKSRLFGGIALELFDFRESKSKVSVAYLDSLDVCLRNGVRLTFVGSLDDQLVSLESSLHAPLAHPYVNRAVFIDGRLHASNFLTHLVAFAIKLRNLGASDHGLIREVSAALAGNIVSGEGHSRLYDDPTVYRMAIEFALESMNMEPSPKTPAPPLSAADEEKARQAAADRRASLHGYPSSTVAANAMRRGSLTSASMALPGIAPVVATYEAIASTGSTEKNPYVLPWAVRGMLAEDCVKNDPKMQQEVKLLVKEFEEWKPASKVLRDVRWRLEGVRSML